MPRAARSEALKGYLKSTIVRLIKLYSLEFGLESTYDLLEELDEQYRRPEEVPTRA